jgi:hypothetical protein
MIGSEFGQIPSVARADKSVLAPAAGLVPNSLLLGGVAIRGMCPSGPFWPPSQDRRLQKGAANIITDIVALVHHGLS